MLEIYAHDVIDLSVDVVAIALLAYAVLNIGIFVAVSLLSTAKVDIALGFGLFAILSIVRLRSSAVTQQEVAYYFVALVMGLVNGLDLADRRFVVLINRLLLVTTLIVDSRRLRDRARRVDVTLDTIHTDDVTLVADLERRLGGQVIDHRVRDVDYVRDTTAVDVRVRGRAPPRRADRRQAGRGGQIMSATHPASGCTALSMAATEETPAEGVVAAAAATVDPIGLAELNALAELQTRVDRKYLRRYFQPRGASALTTNVDRVMPLVAGPALVAFTADPGSFPALCGEHVGVRAWVLRQRR